MVREIFSRLPWPTGPPGRAPLATAAATAGTVRPLPARLVAELGDGAACASTRARQRDGALIPLDRAPAALGALRCGAVLAFARLVHLVGALARPAAAGAGAVPGGVQLVGNLGP